MLELCGKLPCIALVFGCGESPKIIKNKQEKPTLKQQ